MQSSTLKELNYLFYGMTCRGEDAVPMEMDDEVPSIQKQKHTILKTYTLEKTYNIKNEFCAQSDWTSHFFSAIWYLRTKNNA